MVLPKIIYLYCIIPMFISYIYAWIVVIRGKQMGRKGLKWGIICNSLFYWGFYVL